GVAAAAPDALSAQIPVKKNPAASSRRRARRAGKDGRLLVGIFDARVAERNQALGKTLLNEMEFCQRQTALLKLAVEQTLHEQVMHEFVQTVRGRVLHGPARALDGVGQHDNAGLAALRLGSGVTEGRLQL